MQLATWVLRVSESGYYEWRSRAPSVRAVRHVWLTEQVQTVHLPFRSIYGSRRVRRIRKMPVKAARRVNPETGNQHQATPQTPKWNFVAMGQAALTGWTRVAGRPVAEAVARRTGRPEAQILSLIGAAFLAVALIDFLRQVDAVIAAGRSRPSASS